MIVKCSPCFRSGVGFGQDRECGGIQQAPARFDAAPFGFVPRETFCNRFDALWWNSWSSSDSSNVRSSRLVGDPCHFAHCDQPWDQENMQELNSNCGQLFEVHWVHPPVLVAKKISASISKFNSGSWAHFLHVLHIYIILASDLFFYLFRFSIFFSGFLVLLFPLLSYFFCMS